MNTPPILTRAPWLKGAAGSVLLHAALVLPFILHFSLRQPESTPAAVMIEYAPEMEVSFIRPELPAGVSQQRRVDAMTEREVLRNKSLPKLRVQDDAELKLTAAPEKERKKRTETKKKSAQERKEEKGNSTTTSLAAPPVQSARTQRSAAPLDTDAASVSQSKISWESLVKGKINKMRNYPDDARRRKRTGTAVIAFSVDERGEILSTRLVTSSGTLSLDRAALVALESARPLPPPPKEMLRNGVQKVTLPVEFGLLKI
ncbi:energy transducer TonB [Raoultella terrigena]|uniref:energy transducer TonB n=1 Tax=Raoultella terrigena TaxID=577 RepID=UPI003BF51FE6